LFLVTSECFTTQLEQDPFVCWSCHMPPMRTAEVTTTSAVVLY
jgi:hypothetical protein